jgi:peroxiredoxin
MRARHHLAVLLSCVLLPCCASSTGSGGGTTAAGSGGGGGGSGAGPECSDRPASGGSAPDFTLDDLDGNEVHLADRLGQDVILLNFWATWCEPCRIEMPHLDRIQQTYRDRGLRIYAISMDGPESVARVRSHVNRYDFSLAVLLDSESTVSQLYNPRRAAPLNVLIDREGNIAWSREGYNPGDEEDLESQIVCALGDAP